MSPLREALSSSPKRETPAQKDKLANRKLIEGITKDRKGWAPHPGGARYRGRRGLAFMIGKPGAFSVGGTSSRNKPYKTLESAVAAAEKIGGAPYAD